MFDWAFVARYAPFFVNGAWMTLFISVFGIALALLTGIICAAIETARIPVLRQITTVYIEVSRNTPLLVQLYFLYFGLPKMGFVWSAELCAIVGLGFLGGSYMAESMRAGLQSVPQIQRENAYMLGFNRLADAHAGDRTAGGEHIHAGHCGECDLPHQGIVGGLGHRTRRRHVHGEGPHGHVLQHLRGAVHAHRDLSDHSAADFHSRHLA